MASTSPPSAPGKTCDLCCNDSQAWALGFCDHAICLDCSARIRLLCASKDCPVCRKHLDKVLVVKSVQPFAKLSPLTRNWRVDRKNGFCFQSPKLMDLYYRLKSYGCVKCPNNNSAPPPTFHSMKQLREHVNKAHDLHYCDICLQNLKHFPREFKMYSRVELMRHRREGDSDNKSHRGHPLCEFCDDRYFDNDALYTHLRKQHFWCHICESDGKQDFYPDYKSLRGHFKKDHFLCEEGECRQEKFTSVFRTKIDVQAHRATAHAKGLSKSEAKQLRQIDVGFTYTSGGGGEGGRRGSGAPFTTVRSRGPRLQEREVEEESLATALSSSLQIQQPTESRKKKTSPKNERKRRLPVDNAPPIPPIQAEAKSDATVLVGNERGTIERPPGFFTVPPTAKLVTSEWPTDVEWPDLHITGQQEEQQQQQQQAPRPYNIVGFDSAVTQRAPPRSSGNSNLLRLMNSTAKVGEAVMPSSLPPPGFGESGASQPSQIVAGSFSVPRLDLRTVEIQVIKNVHRVLDNDQAKFMQFKTLSGWYRNSEITAAEYVKQCSELFGKAWLDVGPQIAHVMPIEDKRRELLSLFQVSGGEGRRKKTKGMSSQSVLPVVRSLPATSWPVLGSGGGGGRGEAYLSEDDYPTLGATAASGGGPSNKMAAAGPWSGRVSACI